MSLSQRRVRSSVSQKSMSQHLSWDASELSDSELVKQVDDLKREVKMLNLENEIFEKTIMRMEPALMQGVQQALDYANKMYKHNQSESSLTVGSFAKSEMGSSRPSRMIVSLTSQSRVSAKRFQSSVNFGGTASVPSIRINVLERSELVSQEMEILNLSHETVKKKAAKDHAILDAKLEEIDIRVADADKAVDDFHEVVIVQGRNKITRRIPAEIWIRFMTEWVKTIDKQIGKLRLRTSTLNSQYIKLRGQISVKAELHENVRPVDFDKLEIENAESKTLIELKIKHLEELKQLTGDANLYLTMYKKAIAEQNNYLNKVLNHVKDRRDQTVRMNKEKEVIKVQADSLAKKLHQIQKVRQRYEVPDIMDYVGVQSELTDLKHSVKLLENRLHIAQNSLSSIIRKLNSMHMLTKN